MSGMLERPSIGVEGMNDVLDMTFFSFHFWLALGIFVGLCAIASAIDNLAAACRSIAHALRRNP